MYKLSLNLLPLPMRAASPNCRSPKRAKSMSMVHQQSIEQTKYEQKDNRSNQDKSSKSHSKVTDIKVEDLPEDGGNTIPRSLSLPMFRPAEAELPPFMTANVQKQKIPRSIPSLSEFFEREQRKREDRFGAATATATNHHRNITSARSKDESASSSANMSALTYDVDYIAGGTQSNNSRTLANISAFENSSIVSAPLQTPQPQPTMARDRGSAQDQKMMPAPAPAINNYHSDVDDQNSIMELERSILRNMDMSLDQITSSTHNPRSAHGDSKRTLAVNDIESLGDPVRDALEYPGDHGYQYDEPSCSTHLQQDDEDDDDDDDDFDGTTSENNRPKSNASASRTDIARNETRRVHTLRGTILVVLLLAMLAMSTIMYQTTNAAETRRFLNDYENHALTIHAAFYDQVRESITTLDNFGLTTQSFAASLGSNWPFISVQPEWPARVASARLSANAAMVAVLPIVRADQRDAWEEFALNPKSNRWIEESEKFEMEGKLRRSRRISEETGQEYSSSAVNFTQGIPSTLYRYNESDIIVQHRKKDETASASGDVDYVKSSTYLPVWMHSPLNRAVINFDTLSSTSISDELVRAYLHQQLTIGQPVLMHQSEQDPLSVYRCFGTRQPAVCNQPASFISYPVLVNENQTLEHNDDTMKESSKRTVALVTQVIFWKEMLQPNLPSSAEGIDCVLWTECGNSFTFRVDRSGRIEYIGAEDLHDTSYDNLRERVSISQILETANGREELHQSHRGERFLFSGLDIDADFCPFGLDVFPSLEMWSRYRTNTPIWYTAAVVAIFLFTSIVFLIYDFLVERRQSVVMKSAEKSTRIVDGLFPEVVRQRLFGEESSRGGNNDFDDNESVWMDRAQTGLPKSLVSTADSKRRMRSFMDSASRKSKRSGGSTHSKETGEKYCRSPIADLFPDTTVLFADIAGFTAWSSIRDPAQVFILLEQTYAVFDSLAIRRKVFKIETIGDCYVAVTGLPEPQTTHAVIMAHFASGCIRSMQQLTRKLSVTLGPDTLELAIRVGLHSGPVTAGVLRGQKSRFQLFGDTVNTAARMESNGIPNQIHCSSATADLIKAAGKAHWLTPRADIVYAKGKGEMKTYWVSSTRSLSRPSLGASSHDARSVVSMDDNMSVDMSIVLPPPPVHEYHVQTPQFIFSRNSAGGSSSHLQRLIDWNVELLMKLITNIVVSRMTTEKKRLLPNSISSVVRQASIMVIPKYSNQDDNAITINRIPRDEYSEAITLPKFDPKSAAVSRAIDPNTIELSQTVFDQLYEFVSKIAHAHNFHNPFHNFEHATHVVMSANKILRRIVAADDCDAVQQGRNIRDERDTRSDRNANGHPKTAKDVAHQLHDFTFGITSDPLTHFACIFSALVHDVDHSGVGNLQLASEGGEIAAMYGYKSVAEQNSLDHAWNLLMRKDYEDLRSCIFATDTELKRFRQLLVNSVMATDIFDPELIALRNQRWQKVFGSENASHRSGDDYATDLKATIVIEHIIQAADVSHTMQHWHVYQKWNRRLFQEMYIAYKKGRSDGKDPSESWYNGELWFYDNYVIPLAEKLKECGVFGVASDEFLTYALDNRREWELKGRDIVKEMMVQIQAAQESSP